MGEGGCPTLIYVSVTLRCCGNHKENVTSDPSFIPFHLRVGGGVYEVSKIQLLRVYSPRDIGV